MKNLKKKFVYSWQHISISSATNPRIVYIKKEKIFMHSWQNNIYPFFKKSSRL